MTLKDDLLVAITKGLGEVYPLHDDESFGATATVILDHVWDTLEDVVGSAQEHLFQQLTNTRTELDASRRREEGMRGIIRDLQAQLETRAEESSDD